MDLPEGDIYKARGVWRLSKLPEGRKSARVSCPSCGRPAAIHEHEIASDGLITPSLDCPYADCSFHESDVRLLNWAP